jgi:Na+-transporting methylmalonyl-CoA/oxaloacetate decarboxylase gamma subunit
MPHNRTPIESIRHWLYSLGNLVRRAIEYMRKVWEQFLLIALAYCFGLFSPYIRDITVAGVGTSWWAKACYVLAGLVVIAVAVIGVGMLLKRLYEKEEKANRKKEGERDDKMDRIVTALERLVHMLEDGKID